MSVPSAAVVGVVTDEVVDTLSSVLVLEDDVVDVVVLPVVVVEAVSVCVVVVVVLSDCGLANVESASPLLLLTAPKSDVVVFTWKGFKLASPAVCCCALSNRDDEEEEEEEETGCFFFFF